MSVVVITGGTSGFGRADAELFASKGEKVIITGRHEETLKKTVADIGCDSFRADVTSAEDWQALYSYIKDSYGRIDLLINNAGCGVSLKPLAGQSLEEITYAVSVNLTGTIYG